MEYNVNSIQLPMTGFHRKDSSTSKRKIKMSLLFTHQLLSHALFTINRINTEEKGWIPMQKYWATPVVDCYSFTNVEWYFKWHLERTRWVSHLGRGYSCFCPQNAETPTCISDRLIQPFFLKPSTEDTEKKKMNELIWKRNKPGHSPPQALLPPCEL